VTRNGLAAWKAFGLAGSVSKIQTCCGSQSRAPDRESATRSSFAKQGRAWMIQHDEGRRGAAAHRAALRWEYQAPDFELCLTT